MSFLAPLAFLFAPTLPVIIAFYLLKLRRARHEVSSTLLWKRAAEDLQANAPFQKLRRNLLLLLQLLIALILILALARPYLSLSLAGAKNRVLLIDHSASMNTADAAGGGTRLDAAKRRAQQIVNSMRAGDQAIVIAFGSKAEVMVQSTSDQARLQAALRAISPTDTVSRPADALALAQSLARPAKAEIVLLSDGAFSLEQAAGQGGVPLRFESFGSRSNNAGIVGLDLRRTPEKPKEFQVFAQVRNYGSAPLQAKLEVYSNSSLVDVRPVQLPAKGAESYLFSSSELKPGRAELRLTGVSGDDFPADDSAYAVIKEPPARRVVLVSAGNYFLERALRNVPGRKYELARVTPASYTPDMKGDVVIFDGTAPAAAPTSGAYLFINSVPPGTGFALVGEVENPVVFDWSPQHPVMRFVELSDVQIRRAKKFNLPNATQVVAEARDAPLISVSSSGETELVLWAFDLYDTNLPLRMAFPILVSNSIDWLLRKSVPTESGISRTGDVLQVEVANAARQAVMTVPGGQAWTVPVNSAGRAHFDRTSRVGFYRAQAPGQGAEEFGVSLTSEQESDIAPRSSLALGGTEVKAQAAARGSQEVWNWLALGALAVILLEWAVYHRRVLM